MSRRKRPAGPMCVEPLELPERAVRRQILDYLRLNRIPAWLTHDERHRPVETGIADINGVLSGGRLLVIEVKAPHGVVADAQEEWMRRAYRAGACVIVARSVEDVRDGLRLDNYSAIFKSGCATIDKAAR
ncbi:MAG: VRR-NUC domain-containing protein [Dehalococcoidia bacterium]